MKSRCNNCMVRDVHGCTNAVGAWMRRNGPLLSELHWVLNKEEKFLPYRRFHPVTQSLLLLLALLIQQVSACMLVLLLRPINEISLRGYAGIFLVLLYQKIVWQSLVMAISAINSRRLTVMEQLMSYLNLWILLPNLQH